MLAEHVALLGGRLELRAILPDRTIDLLVPVSELVVEDEEQTLR